MAIRLFLALALLLPAPLAADPAPGSVSLQSGWKFRAGDNPGWALPSYPAADWADIAVPGEWETAAPGYDGFGWYRHHLTLPPELAAGPLGVRFSGVGDAFEVYWDGVLIGSSGSLPPHFREAVGPDLFLVPQKLLAGGTDGTHLLAVRVYNDYAWGGLMSPVRVGRYDVLARRHSPGDMVIGGLLSFFLAIGIYHLAFFFRWRAARENLFFALLCALVALYGATYSYSFSSFVIGVINPYRLSVLALLPAGAVFLALVTHLFDLRFSRAAWAVTALFLGFVPVAAVLPLRTLSDVHLLIDFVLALGMLLVFAQVVYRGSRTTPHRTLLVLGVAAFGATVLYDAASEYGWVPVAEVLPGTPGLFWLGFLALLLAMGVATAGRFAVAEVNARTDRLTGLVRRYVFEDALQSETERMKRSGGTLALVLIDLDYFKQINDRYGHRAGDLVLARVGRLLRRSTRNIDVTARFGGEEFGILLFDTDVQGATAFAVRFQQQMNGLELLADGGSVRVTASMGIAVGRDAVDPDALLDAADRVLYQAKEAGRNRLCTVELGAGSACAPPPRVDTFREAEQERG